MLNVTLEKLNELRTAYLNDQEISNSTVHGKLPNMEHCDVYSGFKDYNGALKKVLIIFMSKDGLESFVKFKKESLNIDDYKDEDNIKMAIYETTDIKVVSE